MDSGSLRSTNGLWRYCQWMLPHRGLDHCITQGKDILLLCVTNKSLPKEVPQGAVRERYAVLTCSTSVLSMIFRKMNFLGRYESNPTQLDRCQERDHFCIQCHAATMSNNKAKTHLQWGHTEN